MQVFSIRGGVHPSYHKELTSGAPIEALPLPKRLEIPLSQHLGIPAAPVVSRGAQVAPGDLIAEAPKLISANVHAPVAGKIRGIMQKPLPGGRMCEYAQIDVDEEATAGHSWERREVDLEIVDSKWLAQTMRTAGIVGMGGATFPTDVKFSPPPGAKLDTFILNAAECEPYLTCDHRMMVEHTREILEGIQLAQAAFRFERIIVGIERNKPDAIEAFRRESRNFSAMPVEVIPLEVRYPQGAEKVLIRATTGRIVPAGRLPFEIGVLVDNVQTMYAVQQAAYLGKPLVERVVTVSGSGITNPKNLRVLVGTSVSDIAEHCGGLSPETTKVIVGGPMTGVALPSLDYSVTKGFSGLLFLTQKDYPDEGPCIRCGTCVDVCPMGLMPLKLAAYAKAGKFAEAKATNLADCFECGCCAWACPSQIKIVSWIKFAKNYVRVKDI
jgi:Na+-translocating ferredoxin:NAD+ oxidoreductase subunit C